MGSGSWHTARISKCHIWAWNLAKSQSSRSCTYTLLPQGDEIDLIFAIWAAVSEIRGRFSKLPYLGMKLCHWPKYQKLHIYSFSTPGGLAYFRSMGSGFRDTGRFSNLPYLGMKLGHWPKCQMLHIYPLFTLGGWNWAYFHSTGSGFRDMGSLFKIAIFGHETWPVAKVPDVAYIPSLFPKGSKLSLFSLYWQRFLRYRPFSKLPYLGMKVRLGHWPKCQMLHIYPLSTPGCPN